MVSTFTPNINLEEPARGDYVGTWDTPVNANMTSIDKVVGGGTTISLNNSPIVLSAAQYQAALITFNSTLTGSVAITFPSTFIKSYMVRHVCTGSSAFVITLQTTAAGGQAIGCPPGNAFQIYNDGTNISFINLGPQIGGLWDYLGSSTPNWLPACTVPPFLYANGGAFSAVTYPTLAMILGGTTLPDARGRSRFTLSDGTARLTTAGAGIDGTINLSAGGNNGITLGSTQIPSITSSGSISVNFPGQLEVPAILPNAGSIGNAPVPTSGGVFVPYSIGGAANPWTANKFMTGSNTMASSNPTPSVVNNAPPGYVAGLTFVRAG